MREEGSMGMVKKEIYTMKVISTQIDELMHLIETSFSLKKGRSAFSVRADREVLAHLVIVFVNEIRK